MNGKWQVTYDVEKYWSQVAKNIALRNNGGNLIAGDDDPYYRYKRKRFLHLLRQMDFSGKRILEVGCGPGGNLAELFKLGPRQLAGIDISQEMLDLAKARVHKEVNLIKTDGTSLPFPDHTFDIVLTVTVLQHNTNEKSLFPLLGEICRVSSRHVCLFERIESTISGDSTCLGRPVSYYADQMALHGFVLSSTTFLPIRVSYWMAGAVRTLLNKSDRPEGAPINRLSLFLESGLLPLTTVLDRLIPAKRDVARMTFVRT